MGDVIPVLSRRGFLAALAAVAAASFMDPSGRSAAAEPPGRRLQHVHPEPRPGITGAKVLTAGQLENAPDLAPLFDSVRAMPQIADGIGCYCGCATLAGYRSLLSCYESPGMAQYCVICQGQARLAHRRWREGQTLDQIRRAIDARYGSGGERAALSGGMQEHCGG